MSLLEPAGLMEKPGRSRRRWRAGSGAALGAAGLWDGDMGRLALCCCMG